MKKRKSRIVVDVSDLIHWQGNLSGIQRVVAEMAYRYEKSGAIFCYYLEDKQAFYPLGMAFSEFMYNRQAAMSATRSEPMETKNVSYKTRVKHIGKQIAPPVVVKAAKIAKHHLLKLNSSAVEVATAPGFEFHKNDTLLVFGAHWDKPHYTEVLSDMKLQHSLKVGHLINDIIPIVDKAHVAEVEHTRFPKYIVSISKIADIIYVISKSTKVDYKKFLKSKEIPSPVIQILTLGEDYTSHEPIKPIAITNDEPYILMVGTIEVRKNHALLYSVYKRANELNIKLPKLIIAGRQGWLSGDMYYQMVHDTTISPQVTFIHNATDQELTWLYQNCLFTVFPAFYEGWGLPIAEAAHYGKVTAVSNTSSMPEVVGEGAVYFSPYSADECLSAMQTLIVTDERAKYESILSDRKPISWDDTFNQSFKALS